MGIRRSLRRLIASDAAHESQELLEQVEQLGAERIDSCADRQRVCLAGEVRSVAVDTRGGSPVLEAEIYDGTATVTAVFLGRRAVAGLAVGRSVRIRGRLAQSEGRAVIYNPAYELVGAPVEK